jgi:hypothetical protein
MTTFKWENMPSSIDTDYLEKTLLENGNVIFFNDEDIGLLALRGNLIGLNVYDKPIELTAIANNGYSKKVVNNVNGVVMYNNTTKTSPKSRLIQYAKRIYNLEKTIDVNVQVQKTPFAVVVKDEKTRMSVNNFMQQIDQYKPFVIVDKNFDVENALKIIPLDAPFVSDKLEELKRKLWNEALSFIGIENNFSEKNERLTSDEVLVSNGLAIANKNARKLARERALAQINEMFKTDIKLTVNNIMITETPNLFDEGGVENGEIHNNIG